MAVQPKPAPKPEPKPEPKPTPKPEPHPAAKHAEDPHQEKNAPPVAAKAAPPKAGVAPPEPNLPIGARPSNDNDPQSAKFEAQPGPPYWQEPKEAEEAREEWKPDPSLDAREQAPPPGTFADGMSAPDEQRARAAWVEQHGQAEYDEATDQRPADEKPKYDPHALAGGGAFVPGGGKNKQVPGVTPPTKRE